MAFEKDGHPDIRISGNVHFNICFEDHPDAISGDVCLTPKDLNIKQSIGQNIHPPRVAYLAVFRPDTALTMASSG
jgi:hypothetical protein